MYELIVMIFNKAVKIIYKLITMICDEAVIICLQINYNDL